LSSEAGMPVPDWVLTEGLRDQERLEFGSLHPALMGGEYLPPLEDNEVEIARVSLSSTTGDVNSIRAQLRGDSIRYRIVDEYYDDPMQQFTFSPKETTRPLTMGELVDLIDGVEDEMNPEIGRGLTASYRNMQVDGGMAAKEVVDFVSVSSFFYPEL